MYRHLLIIFAARSFSNCIASDCLWDLNSDMPRRDPVMYQRDQQDQPHLLHPTARGLLLRENEYFEAFCAGEDNYINALNSEHVRASCWGEQVILMDDLKKTIDEMGCVKEVVGDVQDTNISCSYGDGTVLSFGYFTPAGWMQLFESCYDYKTFTTLYAHHVIYGTALIGSYMGSDGRIFRTNGISKNNTIADAYSQNSQYNHFTKLFGKKKADLYMNNNSFLSRAKLAPDADFMLHSWQRMTYFYANAVPQWHTINIGSWLKLENSIRKAAIYMAQDFEVWTGGSGVLELETVVNATDKMYLIENYGLPVPKYIWKLVCNARNFCMAFVVLNDPFAARVEKLCYDVCVDTNWYEDGYDDIIAGAMSCCDVGELKNVLRNIPAIVTRGLLRYPAQLHD